MLDEFKNAFQRHNNAHVQLIIINIVVFLAIALITFIGGKTGFAFFADSVYDQFSIPPKFDDFLTRPWTLFTYMFAHSRSDLLHIVFNMLVLYWFGRVFVEYLGSDKLISVYVLGGLAGGIAYLLMFNLVPYYIDRSSFPGMVGASAAIYAIVVAAATLLPDYSFYLMFLGPVKIKYIAAFYVVISFLGTTQANAGGNIAHLGGALIGFVYMKQLQAGTNWGNWITVSLYWIKNLFKPRSKVKVSYRKKEPVTTTSSRASSSNNAKSSQDEIDAILDKISDRGYESLSKDEKGEVI